MVGWLRTSASVAFVALCLRCGPSRFTPPDGTFSIALPGAVRSGIGSDRTSLGVVPYEEFYSQEGGARFKVSFSVIKGGEGMGEGLLQEFGSRAGFPEFNCPKVSSHTVVGGHPALDYRTKCDVMNVTGRILLVGNRVYQITVESRLMPDEATSKAFIESFRVNDH